MAQTVLQPCSPQSAIHIRVDDVRGSSMGASSTRDASRNCAASRSLDLPPPSHTYNVFLPELYVAPSMPDFVDMAGCQHDYEARMNVQQGLTFAQDMLAGPARKVGWHPGDPQNS